MTGLTVPEGIPTASNNGTAQQPEPDLLNRVLDRRQASATATQEPQGDLVDRILDREQAERDRQLAFSFEQAVRANPELAGEAQRLSGSVGLDPLLVERNIDRVREIVKRGELQAGVGGRVLVEMFRDPMFARVAHDDTANLSALEGLGVAAARGQFGAELCVLASRRRDRGLSEFEEARFRAIERYLDETQQPGGFFRGTAEIVGGMQVAVAESVKVGLATGGGTGLLALPGGPAAASAAAIGGAALGTATELFRQSFLIEGGGIYMNLVRPESEGGAGIDPTTAAWVSRFGGLASAAFGLGGAGFLGRAAGLTLEPVRRAFGRGLTQAATQALSKPTTGQAALEFARGYISGFAGEVGTEGLQKVVELGSAEAARFLTSKPLKSSTLEGLSEMLAEVGDEVAAAAMGMALLSLPGPGLRFLARSQQIRESEAQAAALDREVGLAADSKVRKRNPAAFERFEARATEGQDLYVSGDKLSEALLQSEVTREELARDLPAVAEQLDAAVATGGDVVIPKATYLARIAGQPLDAALRQHTRTDPEGFSQAELEQVKALQKPLAEEAAQETEQALTFAQSARAAEVAFEAQLNAAAPPGLGPREAEASAAVFRAFVETQAKDLGITPEEMAGRLGVRVEREAQTAPTAESRPEGAQAAPATTEMAQPAVEQAPRQRQVEARENTGRELESPGRARFDPASGVIRLSAKADVTSVLHELAHGFLHWMAQAAALPDAPQRLVANFEAFLAWRGIEGGVEAWNAMSLDEQRPHHEAFAESFEDYAFEGQAPSLALARVFESFRRWITRLWRNIRGARPVSPEVRAVFDRMLASEDAIAHAQAVRDTLPVFHVKPEGMSDARWNRLLQRLEDSDNAAHASVRKRSLRAMRWLSGAQSRKLKELQAQAKDTRDAVEAEVREEVEALAVYRALAFVRTGKLVTEGETEVEFEGAHKLHTQSVRDILPEGTDLRPLRMTSPEGAAPDAVAELFGYRSGADLVNAIVAAPDLETVVQQRTDERMTAEHSDLTDAASVRLAIDEALHNPARSRFLAAQLNAAAGTQAPVRLMMAAAREIARATLARMPVAQIKPWRFQAAEVRHNREALQAMAKGDTVLALQHQRAELVQHELAREAAKVEREVEKAEIRFAKFFRSDKDLQATRDIDLIRAGRTLLRSVGFEEAVQPGQAARQEEEALVQVALDFPTVAAGIQALRALFANRNYRQLELDEFRNVADSSDATWKLSRSSQLITIEGRKMEVRAASARLKDAIRAHGPRLAPGSTPPGGITPTGVQRAIARGWHFLASAKRFLHWSKFMDLDAPDGVFQELMLRPMLAALDAYRRERNAIFERLDGRLSELQKLYGTRWDANIATGLVDRTDGSETVLRGVRELVDVVLDVGNTSNQAKRQVGEGWAPDPRETGGVLDSRAWDAFWNSQLQTAKNPQGLIGPELMAFVSEVWAEFEALRPQAQAAHRAIFGYEFEELQLVDVVLPWGTIKGGYAPLRVDYDRARRPRQQEQVIESQAGIEHNFEYSNHAIGAGRGFTITRNPNYYDRLTRDIGRRLQAFDEELRFVWLQPHVRHMLRLTRERDRVNEDGQVELGFESVMNAYDREAIRSIIEPWLDNTARQVVSRPGLSPFVDAAARWVKATTGTAFLGFNVIVAAVQSTGLTLGSTQVQRRYLHAAIGKFLRHPAEAWREAAAHSIRMEERLNTHVDKIRERLSRQSMRAFPRSYSAFKDEANRWAWAPIRLVQGMVDVTIWHAAHQQSIANAAEGAAMAEVEKTAVQDADLAVERSQGGSTPESRARFESDTPTMQLFFQFMAFSNNLLNLVIGQSAQREGLRRLGPWLAIAGSIALWETAVRALFEGLPEDEDDDGYLDEMAERLALNTGRNVLGMVPFFGPSALAALSGQPDRLGTVPAVSAGREALRGLTTFFDDREEVDVQAVGGLLGLLSGLPVRPLAKLLDYGLDVLRGNVQPTSTADYIRGLATGRASEESRR